MIAWGSYRADLQTAFADAVDACLGPLMAVWVVTYGFRTYAEQAALYAAYQAGGAEAAEPGHSAHELGLAIDVALQRDHGALSWNYSTDPEWHILWAAVRAAPILHSGVDFPPPAKPDEDHIERLHYWQFAPPQPESQT